MNNKKDLSKKIGEVLADKQSRNLLLALSGLAVTALVVIIILLSLILGGGKEEPVKLPDKPSEEETVDGLKEEGLADWEKENLENKQTLEFGDVVFEPMAKMDIRKGMDKNLVGIYNKKLLFTTNESAVYTVNRETGENQDIVVFSFYQHLSKDGSQAYFERSDGFESQLIRVDTETELEEIMTSYGKAEIVIDVIDIDNEKGLAIIRDTTTSKTTVRPFYSLEVADKVGPAFVSYSQEVPTRSIFYREGDKIGMVSNYGRMEWNGFKFVVVENWDEDRYISSYDAEGKNSALVYFNAEDQAILKLNGQNLEVEGSPEMAKFLTERVLAIVSSGDLLFYDIQEKKFHKMNDAFDIYIEGNEMFIEKMNMTDPMETLFKMNFTKK